MDDPRRDSMTSSGSDQPDPVIEAYKRHIDRSLLRENLKLAPDERVRKLMAFLRPHPRVETRRAPDSVTTEFGGLLEVLVDAGVEFILVGGLAATVHGSARATYDLDVVYLRSAENIDRLARALAPLKPYLRGAPPD